LPNIAAVGELDAVDADGDRALIASLRTGDERAFAQLVDRHHAGMLRVARAYVATREAAEDVVQDAWLGVIRGLPRFEGRSSLKTWIYRIVVNQAISRGSRDARSLPFAALGPGEPAVDPARFRDSGRWTGWWDPGRAVAAWPEGAILHAEARAKITEVIDGLPANQRLVITLRDVQGFSAAEACELLGISEANQRVLLHRGRARVRAALESYFSEPVRSSV
jgi:RNA polymerase sigma-70 factor (ECF subfamily)